ncbi:MAG: branched-chain amino acid ABC transporter substrate-binding protein [Hyphomicrobiaceae bacterium]|nr:branched-chain amino acid ABC transporter substrate-binding protein [Hyphomicrobiaceae bacterium]
MTFGAARKRGGRAVSNAYRNWKRGGCALLRPYSLLATVFVTVAAGGSPATGQARDQNSGVVDVALAVPLSGPRQGFGHAVRARIELAAGEINARGGILGRPLRVEVNDDACNREGARNTAEAIIGNPAHPVVVIGHPCPGAAVEAASLYQQAGILFLAAGVRHPDLTLRRAGPLVFRAAGRDDRQGHDAGQRLRELAGPDGGTVIIHDRTTMSRGLAEAAKAAAKTDAAALSQTLTIVSSERDYGATVTAVAAMRPKAVLFVGFPAEAAIVIRQLRLAGITVPVLLNDAMANEEFVRHADGLLDDTVEVMMPVSISRDTIEDSETADALAASDAAAALMLWREAAIAVDSTDGERVAERLTASRAHLEEIGFTREGDADCASFAPFRRAGSVWRRVIAGTAGGRRGSNENPSRDASSLR